jgi:hypothetical protein
MLVCGWVKYQPKGAHVKGVGEVHAFFFFQYWSLNLGPPSAVLVLVFVLL